MPRSTSSVARVAAGLAIALPLLAGCALNFIEKAPATGTAGAGTTVVEGRINYFVDGTSRAPYGTFRPKWLAPRFFAHRLETDTTFVSPPVSNGDGSFRWALPPGSYVLTRIGTGTYTDDTYIAWPRVALCVPAASSGRAGGAGSGGGVGVARGADSTTEALYAGHLRLLGLTPNETMVLSTGRVVHFTALKYTFEIGDERVASAATAATAATATAAIAASSVTADATAGTASATTPQMRAPLWRLLPGYPIGDRFVTQMATNRAALIDQACGKPQVAG